MATSEELRVQAAALLRRAEQLESFGLDTFPVGSIITFTKVFPSAPRTRYTYAAIKAGPRGMWFLTGGDTGRQYTWEGLIEWLLTGSYPTTEVWWATEFELVTVPEGADS